jgi:hypothetical protein
LRSRKAKALFRCPLQVLLKATLRKYHRHYRQEAEEEETLKNNPKAAVKQPLFYSLIFLERLRYTFPLAFSYRNHSFNY